jgi:hypothetical protein
MSPLHTFTLAAAAETRVDARVLRLGPTTLITLPGTGTLLPLLETSTEQVM